MLLREGLELSSTGALRRMASAHGLLHDDATTRGELIDRLTERLLVDPTYLQEQLDRLPDGERATLIAARASGGELRGLLVERDHPGAGEALIERGLLFRIFAAAGPLRGEVFEVPEEILARLPQPPAVDAPPAGEAPPAERRASDPAFSLFALVSALTRGGNLEQDVREWSEEPGGWDWEARWTFLRHLAQAAGLLVHQANGAIGPGPTLPRLLDDPPALADRLWRTYVGDRGWSELDRATEFEHGQELADTVLLRAALVDAVQALPEGAWVTLDAFSDWMRGVRPVAIREQLNARGIVLMDSASWADLEQPVLRYALLGPMYWLGVIGTSSDGRYITRRRGALPPDPDTPPTQPDERTTPARRPASAAEACHWEAPADLVAPTRAHLGTLLDAERYLVLRARGRPSRYHLVQSHVAAALGSGGSIADCRRLLRKLTQGPLPETVEERLAAWEQRFGALGVRPAVLIEARSTTELDEAIADERVRPFVRARLGPSVAEVAAAEVLELAAALREGGHLPRVDAALRLASEPRRAYAGLVDEQVLEFLLVGLLAFQRARPEYLGELEGSLVLLARLERQFPPERLSQLRAAAARLAGELGTGIQPPPRSRPKRKRKP
ncbi:MAG: hypothetical protein M3069_06250 [Chloroflexota bacterium]|nr:hypothetical protein [Chloroflexota bacterium]